MVGSILLAEAASRYEADPRLLQHLHAVKHVWLLTHVLTERKRDIIVLFEALCSGGIGVFQVVFDQFYTVTEHCASQYSLHTESTACTFCSLPTELLPLLFFLPPQSVFHS